MIKNVSFTKLMSCAKFVSKLYLHIIWFLIHVDKLILSILGLSKIKNLSFDNIYLNKKLVLNS